MNLDSNTYHIIFDNCIGGQANLTEKVQAVNEFLTSNNYTAKDVLTEINESKSIIQFGEIMDGLLD